LVSWGTAVGLTPELQTGDLVVPAEVGDQQGRRFVPDPALQERVTPGVRPTGRLAEAAAPLCTLEQKLRFAKQHGAVAADMETAAVAKAAKAANLPFAVVRVVVDDLHSEIPPWVIRAVSPRGRARVSAFTRGLLAAPPGDLAHLWRLNRRMRTALETLRRQGKALQWKAPPST
jgi:adenosylhomocysteine nucleosidase